MKFTLICDESSTDQQHMILGTLIIPSHNHQLLSQELISWKKANGFNPRGEFKWKKVSANYLKHYKSLVDWFFHHLQSNHFHFRAHVIDTGKRAYRKYGDGDLEKSFYKVYYHLLYQAMKRLAEQEECSSIIILLDDKTNRYPFRLGVIKKALNSAIKRDLQISHLIANVEPRRSSGPNAEPLIQIVDILIGAIGFVRNDFINRLQVSSPKRELVKQIETLANTSLLYDTSSYATFNIWTFDVEKSLAAKKQRKSRKGSR